MLKKSWLRTTFVCIVGSVLVSIPASYAQSNAISLSESDIAPESIVYNPTTDSFLVSSTSNGTIYEVAKDGTTTPFLEDASLTGSVGMYLDEANGKLYVVNSGLANMVGRGGGMGGGMMLSGQLPEGFDPSQLPQGGQLPEGFDPSQLPQGGQLPEGFDPSQLPQGGQLPEGFDPSQMPDFATMQSISLLVFDVNTKTKLQEVDLSAIAPDGMRFANDVAVDADGNAYVTDSLSGAIYRVDPQGNTAYLSDAQFGAQGFGLNGILYMDGYLLVAKTSDGSLYKIPLDNPANVTAVQLSEAITSADGMTLNGDGSVVIVGDTQHFVLTSTDNFVSATVTASDLGVRTTDVVVVDDTEFWLAPNTAMPTLDANGQITMPTETTAPQILSN